MEYFISDNHFNHARMATMRGFTDSEDISAVNKMNEALIAGHNSVVKENDTTYIVGDFCFRGSPYPFLDRMNGHFIFIQGNHDDKEINSKKVVLWRSGYYDIKLHGIYMTLCHFPMLTWEKSHYGAWHIHGHHHSGFTGSGKMLNVSVESLTEITGFGVPISFDQVVEHMSNRPDNWDFIRKWDEKPGDH